MGSSNNRMIGGMCAFSEIQEGRVDYLLLMCFIEALTV